MTSVYYMYPIIMTEVNVSATLVMSVTVGGGMFSRVGKMSTAVGECLQLTVEEMSTTVGKLNITSEDT